MSSVRDKLWRRLAAGAGVIPACDRELMYEAKEELEKQKAEIERLRAIINAKLHRRKCRDCGHVGWYADSRTPYCLCEQCKSQDTRLVKEEK
jgi:Zn finger protein HypA/HybF involved in hydrogenase expression